MESINLSEIVLPDGLINKIPRRLIEKYQFIPSGLKDNILTAVFAELPNQEIINAIESATNYKIKIALASKSDIQKCLKELFPEPELKPKPKSQPLSLVSEVTEKTEAARTMDTPGKIALVGCFIALFMLGLSVLMPWMKTLGGAICGIRGDGKIILIVSVATAIFLGVTLALKKHLTTSMLVCNAWGTIASFWMIGLVYNIANMMNSPELKDNPFATLFAPSPGIGLYLGLIAAVGLVVATVYQSLRLGTGETFIQKNKLLLGTQAGAVILGVLLFLLLFVSSYARIPQTDEEVTRSRDTQSLEPVTPSRPSITTTKTFKLGEIGFKEVSRFRGWVDYAWKVEITNLTSAPIRVTVKIQLLDTDEFELETNEVWRKEIPANSTETVTNKSSMKADIYDRVKKYNVVVTPSP